MEQPVPYTGATPAAPVAPVQAVAQESLPLPTMQAYRGALSGSVMHVQLADGRILEVAVPPGTPPGHQIHFPVAVAGPIPHGQQPALAPAPQPPMARAGVPTRVPLSLPPRRLCSRDGDDPSPTGTAPGAVFRIKLTDGRDLDVTVPAGVLPGRSSR